MTREEIVRDTWPRFDDGQFLNFGDRVEGLKGRVSEISIKESSFMTYTLRSDVGDKIVRYGKQGFCHQIPRYEDGTPVKRGDRVRTEPDRQDGLIVVNVEMGGDQFVVCEFESNHVQIACAPEDLTKLGEAEVDSLQQPKPGCPYCKRDPTVPLFMSSGVGAHKWMAIKDGEIQCLLADKETNVSMTAWKAINYCPICGRKLPEE